jgi:hypothetical protein
MPGHRAELESADTAARFNQSAPQTPSYSHAEQQGVGKGLGHRALKYANPKHSEPTEQADHIGLTAKRPSAASA